MIDVVCITENEDGSANVEIDATPDEQWELIRTLLEKNEAPAELTTRFNEVWGEMFKACVIHILDKYAGAESVENVKD